MTELRLVQTDAGEAAESGELFASEPPLPVRLPPGRHGIPADLVAQHQRQRLLNAMIEALAELGYSQVTAERVSERAGVSIRTFYTHFGNLWDCLLAAHDSAANRLCAELEAGCEEAEAPGERLAAALDAGLALLSEEPSLAIILGGQPPVEAPALSAARRHLVAHLAAMLRRGREPQSSHAPAGLDERLVDAMLTFIHKRVARGEAEAIPTLGPELGRLLAWGDRSRVA